MFRTALPETLCKVIGFKPLNNAEAVRFIISFAQSKVVDEVFRRRRKINRAMRAASLGSLPSEEFYASLSWKKLRYQALTQASGKCQCCGATGDKSPLHVDHIKPRSKYPDLALDINNLQVLCADCNIGKLNKDETDWRKPAQNDPQSQALKAVK
jgi:5-methylcytosine-specific restriction endonuclease McrA